MTNLMQVPGLEVYPEGKLVVPFRKDSEGGTPVNGEVIADKETGYGKIYVNGRWVLFGQDSVPLVGTKSTAYTQTGSAYVPVDTTAGSFVITLDTLPTPGDRIIFFDQTKTWYQNPITLRSHRNIDGSSSDLVVNVRGGAIELLYVSDTYGYAIIDGETKTDESRFIGMTTISTSTTAQPRYEYIVTSATAGIDLTLPTTAPEGAQIRLTDGAGRASAVSIRLRAATAIINANQTSFEIGNAYGSVTVQGRTVNGTYRWYVIQENAYMLPQGFASATANVSLTNKEDLHIPFNTSSGALTLTLPSSPRPYQTIYVYDHSATWHLNPLTINFSTKSSSSHGGSFAFKERRGYVVCMYNPVTDNWEVASNNTDTDVMGWANRTAGFTASPFMGYRLDASAGSFSVTLPNPAALNEDAVIRLVNVGNTNTGWVRINNSDLEGDVFRIGADEAIELRISLNGSTKKWYIAASHQSNPGLKTLTSGGTLYGGMKYRADLTANAAFALDTDTTYVGQTITLYDPDGGWAGRTITLSPQSGTIDGKSNKVIKKGYARLELIRTNEGYATLSEEYADFNSVPGSTTSQILNQWMHGIERTSRQSGNFTAAIGYFYNVLVPAGGLSIGMPVPTAAGQQIGFCDEYGLSKSREIRITSSADVIGSGQTYFRLASNGGIVLFESRRDGSNYRWYPVLTPEGENKYTYPENYKTPQPNSIVPIGNTGGGTYTLPSNAENGDTVTFMEEDYRAFKDVNVVIQRSGSMTIMDGYTTFTVPNEISALTFRYYETNRQWLLENTSMRINVSTSKLDLTTNLTWSTPTGSLTATPNYGYKFQLNSSKTVTLPTSGVEVGSIVAVSTYPGAKTGSSAIGFSGGTIDGITATSYEKLSKPGESVTLVCIGNGVWIARDRTQTNCKVISGGSNSVTLNFTNNENSYSRTITGNFTLNATFPQGVVTTFYVRLRQDGTGNRAINVPAAWKRSAGSEEFNLLRNTYNLIQGVCLGDGIVHYNVTTYI